MFVSRRSKHNPIFGPERDNYWEGFAAFNMCPVKVGRDTYGFYRAISVPDALRTPQQISIIGKCESRDGIHFTNRKPFITPQEEWDKFGCEDPRVTFFEGKYYIFYTAISKYPLDKDGIKVAVAISKDLKKVEERHLVTNFNAKAMTLFPERINGKITVIFSAHTDSPPAKMAIVQVDRIEELWSVELWEKKYQDLDKFAIDPRRSENDHVEVGAPPIKTKHGWLIIYSYIRNYFRSSGEPRLFGIEALLVDLTDPTKIITRTERPMIVPKETYELLGTVPNVIFPTGAILKENALTIYYGATDTTTCIFSVSLHDFLHTILPVYADRHRFKRAQENPIIKPLPENAWETKATFNPGALRISGVTHIVYRAMSEDNTSVMGYAATRNGVQITERLKDPIYVPREEFEMKKKDNANSGCEDPRLTKIGKNIYMCYTAFDGIGPPRVAITSITEKNFLAHKWEWSKPVLITPSGFDDKDACIFPQKFKEGYLIFHRVNSEICGDYIPTLDFQTEAVKKCIRIIGPRVNMWDSSRVGIASPPIKTKYGWLLIYHGANNSGYRVGAVLLDLKDPTVVLARSTDPILEPVEAYEKDGIISNVVFPCGSVVEKGIIYLYYGGADKVVGVATMELDIVVDALRHARKLP